MLTEAVSNLIVFYYNSTKFVYFPSIFRLFAFCLAFHVIALFHDCPAIFPLFVASDNSLPSLTSPRPCYSSWRLPLHCRSDTTANHKSGCCSPRSVMNNGPEVKIGSMSSTVLVRINKKRLEVALRLVSGALISLTRLMCIHMNETTAHGTNRLFFNHD
jgi:hypothetical protein